MSTAIGTTSWLAYEDYQLNLPRALEEIRSFTAADVVELGTGTGRVTMLYAAHARSVVACDRELSMLRVAARKFRAANLSHVRTAIGDNRRLPLPDRTADIAIAGWSIGHTQYWSPETWQAEVDRALGEMRRMLRPGGTLIIIETLGTGQTEPAPPHERLAAYYAYLEQRYGFQTTAIRTDLCFDSVEQAAELTGFFFGEEFAQHVVRERWQIVPECTGLWWKYV